MTNQTLKPAIRLSRTLLLCCSAMAAVAASPSMAQDAGQASVQTPAPTTSTADPAQAKTAEGSDVVVTGTLIRGVATPVGSNLQTLNAQAIAATGSITAIDVLNQTVPQLSTFNALSVGGADFGAPVTQISLRGFGNTAGNASGQSATLLLLNGHRLVPVGILSTNPDPDLIPADVIDSVQVLPDGGSATYGSDAIGGVVNFVLRKRVDGLLANYQHRFAGNYNENNVSLTGGTHWSTGSVLLSGVYANHDAVQGRDRAYVTANFAPRGGNDYRLPGCPYGSFTVNGKVYTGSNFQTVPAVPLCEPNDYSDLVPREERGTLFGDLEQEIAPNLQFSMDGLFSIRKTWVDRDVATIPQTLTITSASPFFRSVQGETSQSVTFNVGRGIGPSRVSPQTFKEWQIDPSLTWTISDRWRLRGDFLTGQSFATISDRTGLNGDALSANTINPYDPAQSNPAALTLLANHEIYTRGVNKLTSGQLVADGQLFSLPGGAVKVALGGEIRRQILDNSTVTGLIGDRTGLREYDAGRTVKAVFAEAFVPLVGDGNQRPLLRSLSFDAAVRYDHYSDFGGTTNPRIGIDYRPIRDLRLRANYQTTFVAPSLADSGNKIDTRFQILTLFPNNYLVFIAGAGDGLRPQTSRNFSIGADFTPHGIDGLKVGITYWNTRIEHVVSLSLSSYGGNIFTSPYNLCGAGFFTFPAAPSGRCTAAYLNSIQPIWVRLDNGAAPGIRSIADLFAPGVNVTSVIDARRANFGTERISGLDFDASYRLNVPFGTVFAQAAGTYLLDKAIAPTDTAPFVDYLSGEKVASTPRLNLVGTLGGTAGRLTASVTVRHNSGVKLPLNTIPGQTGISSFTVADAAFDIRLGSFAFARSINLTLTVQNLLDQDPPFSGAQQTTGILSGFANGGTLGRAANIGIRARF